ncbi:IS5 family transposase [Vibrio sp. SM6]|uniref:IS5 family transposase n=1 Tax=Vibrio agarilyticus TaxID=2726741 RepID=A0A7X8TS53_9VIBR|nr:IS5 family transposase [Vibrio agarilyticus]
MVIVITEANVHDIKLALDTVDNCQTGIKNLPLNLCLDKGYDSQGLRISLMDRHFIPHVRSRGEEKIELENSVEKKARRWVVERSHSWLNRHRRILVRWEKKIENYEAMLHLACSLIVWNKNLSG